MSFYHGRSKSRPYYGNSIYITNSISYASIYSDTDFVYEVEILFDLNQIFSIKNKSHLDKVLPFLNNVVNFNAEEELEWTDLDLLSNENFECGEDLVKSLGFKGIYLKERTGIDSILVFDQQDVKLISKVNF